MSTIPLLLALLSISTQSSDEGREPFHGSVAASGQVSYGFAPPRPEPEGPTSPDRRSVPVLPAPDLFSQHPHPMGGRESMQAIQIDAATGRETFVDLATSRRLERLWVEGRSHVAGQDELVFRDPDWPSDLSSVTSPSFPWSSHCRIRFRDPVTGLDREGSGTLIDAKYVITSGAVVHKGNGGGWYTDFRVYPAWDGDADAYGEAGWTSAATFSGWSANGSLNDCMGFIRLDRPVGFLTGWMGYGYDNDDSFYTSTLFNAAGYPSSCYSGAPDQLYYGWGSYDSVTTTILTAAVGWTCSTGGTDGMASYHIDSNQNRFVHGCHASRCYSCIPNTVGHTRMTQGKHDYFDGSFLPGGYSTTSPDYVPLDVNTASGDASVTAGDSLQFFDYLVANSSMFNPVGTQIYTVDVYLSTNDFISTADTLIESHQFSWNFGSRTAVRVSPQPPTIPANTSTGNYWLGVIVTGSGDANSVNDDTSGWDAVPITVTSCQVEFNQIGQGLAGSGQFIPLLFGSGNQCQAGQHSITITGGLGGAPGYLWLGFGQVDLYPFLGGHFYVDLTPPRALFPLVLNGAIGAPGAGFLNLPGNGKAGYQGLTFYLQGTFFDPGAVEGVSMTNALEFVIDD